MNIPDILVLPLIASVLAAVACGCVGTLTLVRRDTYVAGAVSHAVLAGLGLAQYLAVVHGATRFTPTLGALLAAITAALAAVALRSRKQSSNDSALSAIWASGMAIGIGFMSITPGYQADLMNFLFGSILLVSVDDIHTMLMLNTLIIAALALFWRGILATTFNPELATVRGVRTRLFETIISLVTAIAVVLLVRITGIMLVIALLTLPAMGARSLFRRLIPSMLAAMALAFLAIAAGIAISWYTNMQPAAPIVLAAVSIAIAAHGINRLLLLKHKRAQKHLTSRAGDG